MSKKFHNLDFLTKISVSGLDADWDYSYRKERKILGFIIKNEGYYRESNDHHVGLNDEYIGLEAPENRVLYGDLVFIKPKVTLTFNDGNEKDFYFDTYDKALSFSKKFMINEKWI